MLMRSSADLRHGVGADLVFRYILGCQAGLVALQGCISIFFRAHLHASQMTASQPPQSPQAHRTGHKLDLET